MTETKEIPGFAKDFILHWGEMGTRWGINRTVAQVQALLFLSERPLPAEEICAQLEVARSNVSTSLKELQNWGIVKTVHLPGDRRVHFECLGDVFEMFRRITAERKRREIDPTLEILEEFTREAAESEDEADDYAQEKLAEMLNFFQSVDDFYRKMSRLPTKAAKGAFRMSDQLASAILAFSPKK